MGLYALYLITGLANVYLFLSLEGGAADATSMPGLALVGAIALFAVSGISLFRERLASLVAIILLSPILLWQITVIGEQRDKLGVLSQPAFLLPLACAAGAFLKSLRVLFRSFSMVTRLTPKDILLRFVLALVPPGLVASYILWRLF